MSGFASWSSRRSRNREHKPYSKYYTGLSSDVARRLAEHNAGPCSQTADNRPWSVDVAIEFADERRAVAFEPYLKSGSGVAFPERHLRQFRGRQMNSLNVHASHR